jgi:hypothetical protein
MRRRHSKRQASGPVATRFQMLAFKDLTALFEPVCSAQDVPCEATSGARLPLANR